MRIWRQRPLQREYISELDRLLTQLDTFPSSTSPTRQAEEAEFAKIDWLRDHAEGQLKQKVWKKL